jgi:hypothetical protein
MTDTALVESAAKAHPTWWKVIVGLLLVGAAIKTATSGHIYWPQPHPAILYAVSGALFILHGLKPIFRRNSK